MNELLSRHTKMQVSTIANGQEVEADCIYLSPPKHQVEYRDDRLWLNEVDGQRSPNHPIDFFFSSLAAALGKRAVAVVLSGTGTDGTTGVTAIRQAGGVVVVQEPRSATFDGIPRSALGTGSIDIVCPPEEIPAKLMQLLAGGVPAQGDNEYQLSEHDAENAPLAGDVPGLFGYLRKRFGVDFSLYKKATIQRRLHRRMEINGFVDLTDYISRINTIEGETESLFRDFLVDVTRFFRDETAFDLLREQIIPAIVKQSVPPQPIRVWSAGCATGEEAYSIAMLIAHECHLQNRSTNVRIFATDLHDESLKTASAGKYHAEAIKCVPAELRDKYFVAQSGAYTICPEIRRMVNFTVHDLIEDPPLYANGPDRLPECTHLF